MGCIESNSDAEMTLQTKKSSSSPHLSLQKSVILMLRGSFHEWEMLHFFPTALGLVWSQPIPPLCSGHARSMPMFFWCGAVKARQCCWRKCEIGLSGLFPGSAPQHHNFIFQRQQQQNKFSMTCPHGPELTVHTSRCRCCCFFCFFLRTSTAES